MNNMPDSMAAAAAASPRELDHACAVPEKSACLQHAATPSKLAATWRSKPSWTCLSPCFAAQRYTSNVHGSSVRAVSLPCNARLTCITCMGLSFPHALPDGDTHRTLMGRPIVRLRYPVLHFKLHGPSFPHALPDCDTHRTHVGRAIVRLRYHVLHFRMHGLSFARSPPDCATHAFQKGSAWHLCNYIAFCEPLL